MTQLRIAAPKQPLLLGPPQSKISYVGLHEAVIEYGIKNKAMIPMKKIKSGMFFRRSIANERIGDFSKVGMIFSKPGGDTNRFDGITSMGNTTPAIYLSADTEAANAEGLYYADKSKYSQPAMDRKELTAKSKVWLPDKTIVTFQTVEDVELADFRMDSPEGMQFLKQLNQDPAVRKELASTPYAHVIQGLQSAQEYSVPRGLAYLADQVVNANGSTWNTARISRNADRFSDNATLTGEYLKPVPQLRPVFAQEYHEVQGKLYYIMRKLDPTINPDDFAPFPEGERVEPQVPGIEDEFVQKS